MAAHVAEASVQVQVPDPMPLHNVTVEYEERNTSVLLYYKSVEGATYTTTDFRPLKMKLMMLTRFQDLYRRQDRELNDLGNTLDKEDAFADLRFKHQVEKWALHEDFQYPPFLHMKHKWEEQNEHSLWMVALSETNFSQQGFANARS